MTGCLKKKKNVDVFTHFYGRFESGLPNIFKGCIPKSLDEVSTYKFIKQYSKELKIKGDNYLFMWQTPFKYIEQNKMITNNIPICYKVAKYNNKEYSVFLLNLKRDNNKIIFISREGDIDKEIIYNVDFRKGCKLLKKKWIIIPKFESKGINENIYVNNIGISEEKLDLKLNYPPSDFLISKSKVKIKLPFIWLIVNDKNVTLNYGIKN